MHEQLIKQSVSNTYLFLNHLYDEKHPVPSIPGICFFLNHLYDEKRFQIVRMPDCGFLNHLYDEKLELSTNKTLKNNKIKF